MTAFVWNGSIGAYTNPANWSPMGVPGSGDLAVIASGGAEIAGATLDGVTIQLGSTGVNGTLAATAPIGTRIAGGVTNYVLSVGGIGAEGNLNIAGDFTLGEGFADVDGEGSQLTITLAPAPSGSPGLLVTGGNTDSPEIGCHTSNTLLIAPLSQGDHVAFDNANGGVFTSGDLIDQVPTSGGYFDVEGGVLEFGSSVRDSLIFLDAPPGAAPPTLVIGQPSSFRAAIGSSLTPLSFGAVPGALPAGTSVDLRGLSASSLAFSQGGQSGAQAIELLNGMTVVETLNLETGTDAFGVSLGSDGAGGTLLRVDVSSNSPALGRMLSDPTVVQVDGSRAQFSVSAGETGITLAGPTFTDLVTPNASLSFIDGELFFDPNSQGGTIYRFYEAALGRTPDSTGLSYWNDVFNQEGGFGTADAIAAGFLSSREYLSEVGKLHNADFVSRLYANMLGRSPDPSGDAYWNGLLLSGESRATVLTTFVTSPEAVQHSAAAFADGLFIPNSV